MRNDDGNYYCCCCPGLRLRHHDAIAYYCYLHNYYYDHSPKDVGAALTNPSAAHLRGVAITKLQCQTEQLIKASDGEEEHAIAITVSHTGCDAASLPNCDDDFVAAGDHHRAPCAINHHAVKEEELLNNITTALMHIIAANALRDYGAAKVLNLDCLEPSLFGSIAATMEEGLPNDVAQVVVATAAIMVAIVNATTK